MHYYHMIFASHGFICLAERFHAKDVQIEIEEKRNNSDECASAMKIKNFVQ